MKHYLLILAALFLTATSAKAQTRISVHDPSVVDAGDGTYYIFGSHQAWAKTADLYNWNSVQVNWGDGTNSHINCSNAFSTQKVTKYTKGGTEYDFTNFDAKAWSALGNSSYDISGNLWAPDVIWNPIMQKWCMYLSINGDNANCSIVLLTADDIEGPYVYQAPIVMSGFFNTTFDYKKTNLEQVIGEQSSLPERYNVGDLKGWRHRWPNCIDPCVFYDKQGKLWMSYGSWHGGIYMLELDENTGLRDYNVSYPLTGSGDNYTSDPYFGTKIAGGFHVSGEASYIKHIGDYYYLFITYGGLVANGGYQMRVFRSSNPDGPYTDSYHSGAVAIYDENRVNFGPDGTRKTDRGENIFGAYGEWGNVAVGASSERSQGHNSVLVKDGRTYLVYHTRFQDRGEQHEVRVHQLFLNQDGWLCAAPFEYKGEKTTDNDIANGQTFGNDEIAGKYKLLIHTYNLDHKNKQLTTPVNIVLNSDGTISGDATGTWSTESGTSYITVTVGGNEYKGVVVEQTVDGTTTKTICFTAYAKKKGYTVWGYQLPNTATTTVGTEDNTTAWWTQFSDWYTIEPDKTLTITFTNYSSKKNNYNNWASEIVSAESGYEWLLMRADCFGVSNGGWAADGMNTNNNTSGWFNCNYNNYDWNGTNFVNNLDGATVKLTVKRNGDFLSLIEDVTTADGSKKFRHYFSMYCVADNKVNLKLRLTVDNAHIVIDNNYEYGDSEPIPEITGTLIGNLDNSTPWWTAFSDYYTIKPDETKKVTFKNYSCKVGNYHNFVAFVTTDADRAASGYQEYFGLRADNWLLVADKNADKCNYEVLNWNWETIKDKLDGATVTLTVTRTGADVKIRADIAPADGSTNLYEEYTQACGDGTQNVRLFFVADGSHFDLLGEGDITGISAINAQDAMQDAPMYNLSGRRVDANYKGIVIQNGKKMIVK